MGEGWAWRTLGSSAGRAVAVGGAVACVALVLAGFPADGLASLAQAPQSPESEGVWAPAQAPRPAGGEAASAEIEGSAAAASVTEAELETGFRVVIGEAVLRIYDAPKASESGPKLVRTSRQ